MCVCVCDLVDPGDQTLGERDMACVCVSVCLSVSVFLSVCLSVSVMELCECVWSVRVDSECKIIDELHAACMWYVNRLVENPTSHAAVC